MTTDEMIQQCATDVDEVPLAKTNGAYAGNEKTIAEKIVSGLNYAYHKICREKYHLVKSDTVTLDANKSFTAAALSSPLVIIKYVRDPGTLDKIPWKLMYDATFYVPSRSAGDSLLVEYAYLPPKLAVTDLAGVPLLPEGVIDHRILTYYADFYFLTVEGDDSSREKAQTWLALFNEGYKNIFRSYGEVWEIPVE